MPGTAGISSMEASWIPAMEHAPAPTDHTVLTRRDHPLRSGHDADLTHGAVPADPTRRVDGSRTE